MIAPGIGADIGISVNISDPLAATSGDYLRDANLRFGSEIESYQHTIEANGGFKTASFTIKMGETEIDEWLEYGIGRHVVVYSPYVETIWEGFVDKITINIGSLSAVRGPLFDVANRVMVVYTPIIDATVDPPVTGSATETPIAESSGSQSKYGIIEKIVSGGQLLDDGTYDEAEEIRDLYLAEMKEPFTDETINIGASSLPTVTIDCLGYYEWFKVYAYNYYTSTTVQLDVKVEDVLNADPNGIFSTDQSNIDSNAQITNRLEDKNRMASAILEEITKLGDGSDNRWVFQCLEDRVCYYNSIPTTIDYQHTIKTSADYITSIATGETVKPWDFRPAVWVELSDFLLGRSEPTTSYRQDPRLVFAESVTYTAPFGISIIGSRMSKLPQRLAQLGVGGA